MSEIINIKIDDKWRRADKEVADALTECGRVASQLQKKYSELKAATLDMREKQKLSGKHPKAFNLLDAAQAAADNVDRILAGKGEAAKSEQATMF